MTHTLRNSAFGLGLLALSIGSATAATGRTAPTSVNPLQVVMVPVAARSASEFLGAVRFTMTNTSNETVITTTAG